MLATLALLTLLLRRLLSCKPPAATPSLLMLRVLLHLLSWRALEVPGGMPSVTTAITTSTTAGHSTLSHELQATLHLHRHISLNRLLCCGVLAHVGAVLARSARGLSCCLA